MISNRSQEELNMPTVGYWPSVNGVELKKLEYDCGEHYAICAVRNSRGNFVIHRLRIRYTRAKNSRAYINLDGQNFYLDECLRTDL